VGEKLGDLHGNDDNAEKSRGKGAMVITMVAALWDPIWPARQADIGFSPD